MNNRAFSPIEEIIVLAAISIFVAVLYHKYNTIELRAKTEETKIDLYNLNLASKLFRIKNGRYSSTLHNLYSKKNLKHILQKSRLEKQKIIDPFGNPYIYDNKNGKIYLNPKTREIIHSEY